MFACTLYRVYHLVVLYLLLISKQKFCHSIDSLYKYETFKKVVHKQMGHPVFFLAKFNDIECPPR